MPIVVAAAVGLVVIGIAAVEDIAVVVAHAAVFLAGGREHEEGSRCDRIVA
jgi:hypothetical protein